MGAIQGHVIRCGGIGAALCLAGGVSAQGAAAPGAYAYVLSASDDIHAAIDHAVEHMSFISRPIARRRLRATNPVPAHLRIEAGADTVVLFVGEEEPARLPRDGGETTWHNLEGNECRVSMRLAGDTLVEHVVAHGGESERRLSLADSTARIDVRITSPHLPLPVVYSVTFARAP